jgi:hypothetical protein
MAVAIHQSLMLSIFLLLLIRRMNIDKHVHVFAKKIDGAAHPEKFLGYASQVDKSDFFCYELIILRFISGIPEEEIAKINTRFDRAQLKNPRPFAEIHLKKVRADSFFGPYLNPETHPMADRYLPFFSRYLNEDGQTIKPEFIQNGFLTFAVDLQEFKRIYEPIGLENNPSKGTYGMNVASFKKQNGRPIVEMLETKLLNDNWSKESMQRKFMNASSIRGQPPIGKKSYFLNPKAAKELFMFTERFLKEIGFDVILLKADTLSLAVKVYGPWGYYPMYRINSPGIENEINNLGIIQNLGNKVFNLQSHLLTEANKKRLVSCDYTSGPLMFKFINTERRLSYNWTVEKKICKNPFLLNTLRKNSRKEVRKYGTFSGGKTRKQK